MIKGKNKKENEICQFEIVRTFNSDFEKVNESKFHRNGPKMNKEKKSSDAAVQNGQVLKGGYGWICDF